MLTFITLYLQGIFCHFSGFRKRIKFHPPRPVYSGAPVVTPMAGGSLPRHLVVGNLGQRWIQSMSFCLGWNGFKPRLVRREIDGNWRLTRDPKTNIAAISPRKIGFLSQKRNASSKHWFSEARCCFRERVKLLDAFSLFDLPQTWVIWWPLA